MNTTINSSSNRHQLSVSKSGHSVRSLDVRLDFGSVMSFVPQELFDALRAAGFVDTPKTVRDEVEAMEVGTRFKIDQIPSATYFRSGNGFKSEGNSYEHRLDAIVHDMYTITVLPPLPKGDEIVRDLTPGVKFTVGDESFIRTDSGSSVSLAGGALYFNSHFAGKTVVVSK